MWKFEYQQETDVPIEKLWAVMKDIENWHTWDDEIEYCTLHGQVAEGETFTLKPKGGPKVKITIEEHKEPNRHVDLSHLPLGKMRFLHEFTQNGEGSIIKMKLEIWGVLGFLWQKILGEKQAAKMEANANAFISAARTK